MEYHQSRPGLEVLQHQIDDFVTDYEEKLEEVNVLKNFRQNKQRLDSVSQCFKILLLYTDFFQIVVFYNPFSVGIIYYILKLKIN